MEDVMNNNDLRRVIWSYLRFKPKISCHLCKDVCVWDKKRRKQYFYVSVLINKKISNVYYCKNCWYESIPNNPYFNCIVS